MVDAPKGACAGAVAALALAFVPSCSAPLHFDVDPASAQEQAVVPLILERSRPLLAAEIDGHAVTLLLDLGADVTIGLHPASADAVGANFTGSTKSVSDAFGNVTSSRRYVLTICKLGSLELRDVEGWEQTGDFSDDQHHVDGIVGWRLLEKFGVLIDFPRQELRLVPPGALHEEFGLPGWLPFPIEPTADGLSAAVTIEARPMHLILDTGATWSVLKAGRAPEDRLTDRNGVGFFRALSVTAGAAELGPLDFAVLDLAYPEGDGILGFNFFMARAVWIDWPAGRAAIDVMTPTRIRG